MGDNAFKICKNGYLSWKNIAPKTIEVYKRALEITS